MQMKDIVEQAEKELTEEKAGLAKEVLKERIKEIGMAKRTLTKLEDKYNKLLEKTVDEVAEENAEY